MELILIFFIVVIAGLGAAAIYILQGGTTVNSIQKMAMLHLIPPQGYEYDKQSMQDFWHELVEIMNTSLAGSIVSAEIIIGKYGLHWLFAVEAKNKNKISQLVFQYFPNCRVEEVTDYAVTLKTAGKLNSITEVSLEKNALPIADFGSFIHDPQRYLEDLLSKINQGEECWVQLTLHGGEADPVKLIYSQRSKFNSHEQEKIDLKAGHRNVNFALRIVVKAYHKDRLKFLEKMLFDYLGLFNNAGVNRFSIKQGNASLREAIRSSLKLSVPADPIQSYLVRRIEVAPGKALFSAELAGLFHLPTRFSPEGQALAIVKENEILQNQVPAGIIKASTYSTEEAPITMTEVKPVTDSKGDPLAQATKPPEAISAERYEELSRADN